VKIEQGLQVLVPLAATAAATLLFMITIALIHRSLWARILGPCLLLLLVAAEAGFVYLGSTH
jgi:hypothetical protein